MPDSNAERAASASAAKPAAVTSDDERMALLRQLLTADLRVRLDAVDQRVFHIEGRFGDDARTAQTLAAALPGAVKKAYGPGQRPKLDDAMANPWIGAASHVADHQLSAATLALSPMVLPAISQAVKDRLAAFSDTMQRASPARRIGWKIKSLQSGLPLEQVIEQDMDPFCVHRVLAVEMPAGHLLGAYQAPAGNGAATVSQTEDDANATAALLAAIQGFARDAGIGTGGSELSSIEVGKRQLVISQQGSLLVAVEASGQLAPNLQGSIHGDLFPAVRAAETEETRRQAMARWCRDSFRPAHKQTMNPGSVIGLLALLVLALWWTHSTVQRYDMQRTRDRIEDIPGVAAVRLSNENKRWRLHVAGDPLVDLTPAFERTLMNKSGYVVTFDPILSLDAVSIERAIRAELPPPPGTEIFVADRVVRVSGTAAPGYVAALRDLPRVRLAQMKIDVSAARVESK
jgi:hypothetical protein